MQKLNEKDLGTLDGFKLQTFQTPDLDARPDYLRTEKEYLEGGELPADASKYAAADAARLRAWKADKWAFVGVVVVAGVEVQREGRGPKFIPLGNASLWGCEDDNADHLNSVAEELKAEAVAEAKEVAAQIAAALTKGGA